MKRGQPLGLLTKREQFLLHVVVDEHGCWRWQASKFRNGYPQWRSQLAHRVSYRLFIEDVPSGLTLDHHCQDFGAPEPRRDCVNPLHLEPATMKANNLRGRSPSAVNARRIECVNGHPFTSENTYVDKEGKRKCRRCNRERVARYRMASEP